MNPRSKRTHCDGFNRRDVLKIGTAAAFGLPFTFSNLLAKEATAPAADRNDISFIYVFLRGGLSTIDTFDLKPDAPSSIRGPFQSIPTSVPGTRVCHLLPNTARVVDKFAQIRSFTHNNAGHGTADHYMLTGYHPSPGFNAGLRPNNEHPSFGSVMAHRLGPRGSIPPYICLPTMHKSASSAYLGPKAVPFTIEADPNSPGFSVPDLQPPLAIDANRLANRRELLRTVDRFHQSAEQRANADARQLGVFAQRATDLITSKAAKTAFDLGAEPEPIRARYGHNTLGQSCLMARRLVEAGVRTVTIEHADWDTHSANFQTLEDDLLPKFDLAIPTLFQDLEERGLLEKTVVLVTGEFGRTPAINKEAGRDHWSRCFTVLLGGGGIQGGRVIGRSDATATDPAEDPYGPEDLAATLYHLVGINPRDEMITPEGRPIMLSNGGRVIEALL